MNRIAFPICCAALLALALPACGARHDESPTGSVAEAVVTDSTVYDDQARGGWSYGYWATTNFSNRSPVFSGLRSISVTFQPSTAMYLTHAGFATAGYDRLELYVNGGAANGRPIAAAVVTPGNVLQTQVPLSDYCAIRANTWTKCTIPLAALNANAATLIGVSLWETGGQAQPTMYVDQIRFLAAPVNGGSGGATGTGGSPAGGASGSGGSPAAGGAPGAGGASGGSSGAGGASGTGGNASGGTIGAGGIGGAAGSGSGGSPPAGAPAIRQFVTFSAEASEHIHDRTMTFQNPVLAGSAILVIQGEALLAPPDAMRVDDSAGVTYSLVDTFVDGEGATKTFLRSNATAGALTIHAYFPEDQWQSMLGIEVTNVSANPLVGLGTAKTFVPGGSTPVADAIRSPAISVPAASASMPALLVAFGVNMADYVGGQGAPVAGTGFQTIGTMFNWNGVEVTTFVDSSILESRLVTQPGQVTGNFTSKGSGYDEYFSSLAVVLR